MPRAVFTTEAQARKTLKVFHAQRKKIWRECNLGQTPPYASIDRELYFCSLHLAEIANPIAQNRKCLVLDIM